MLLHGIPLPGPVVILSRYPGRPLCGTDPDGVPGVLSYFLGIGLGPLLPVPSSLGLGRRLKMPECRLKAQRPGARV